nr:PepSY-like domain-containing protein [uncultured Alistipes sp.]
MTVNMLKKWMIYSAAALALFTATGCDMDDDDDDRLTYVPSGVEETFRAMYPRATSVRWSDRSGYIVADFREDGTAAQAWFLPAGEWHMTDTDIRYAELPQAVRTAFETGDYASWRVDDVDLLSRRGLETVYSIEVERGESEYELLYAEDGILLSALPDTDGGDHADMLPSNLPQGVQSYLSQHYPDARVVDTEFERGVYEVEIVDGRTVRELRFDADGNWLETRTEVRVSSLPAAVLDAVRTSQYGSWQIEDADLVQTPDGEWYEVELEEPRTDREARLRVRADGTIL